jgi:hypothetical protein
LFRKDKDIGRFSGPNSFGRIRIRHFENSLDPDPDFEVFYAVKNLGTVLFPRGK